LAGYSIVEIMVVLAISGLLLVSAITLFGPQRHATEFNQAIQDLSSEISTRVKEVNSSLFRDVEQYTCKVKGNPPRAKLSVKSQGQGTNPDCLVLGKAFEVIPDSSDMYIYTVLGNRQTYNASGQPIGLPTSISETNPEPALDFTADLTQHYSIPGAKIISSKVQYPTQNQTTSQSFLVGYYNDLGGNVQLTTRGYNYPMPASDHKADLAQVKSCIEEQGNCQKPLQISMWEMCVQDYSGTREAFLDIINSAQGISTNLKFQKCSS